jgi:hypothetical protein
MSTYRGELVAADDAEHFAIKGDVHAVVDVFPVPVIPPVVLWQTLALDQLAWKSHI